VNRALRRAAGLVFALLACSNTAPAAPDTARRIVSQTLQSDEILWDLGADARARVVAVSSLADDERYSTVPARWPASTPRSSGTAEELLTLRPDVVVVADFTAPETLARLHDQGIPSLRLTGFTGFTSYREHVAQLAALAAVPDEGRRLVAQFDGALAALPPAATDPPGIVAFSDGIVPGADTTFDDEARAAGFDNVAARHGLQGHVQVTVEQIVTWDPEWLVVPCADPEGCEQVARRTAGAPGFAATRAARTGHVVALPAAQLFSTGAGMASVAATLSARRRGG
jgi:iron complex transport system substrate-binding protein